MLCARTLAHLSQLIQDGPSSISGSITSPAASRRRRSAWFARSSFFWAFFWSSRAILFNAFARTSNTFLVSPCVTCRAGRGQR